VGSKTFCPARLTTATVLTGKPDSASSVWKKWKNSKSHVPIENNKELLC
jgi:hypothetical protein